MPKKSKLLKDIKEAKFLQAVVDNAGDAKEAYKAIRPHVTDGSAASLGSRELQKVNKSDIESLYEEIGCTKKAVLTELWERMKTAKTSDFNTGTRILAKIANWETKNNQLRDLLDKDLDLIEVVKVRLRKSKRNNDLDNNAVIDAEHKVVDDNATTG